MSIRHDCEIASALSTSLASTHVNHQRTGIAQPKENNGYRFSGSGHERSSIVHPQGAPWQRHGAARNELEEGTTARRLRRLRDRVQGAEWPEVLRAEQPHRISGSGERSEPEHVVDAAVAYSEVPLGALPAERRPAGLIHVSRDTGVHGSDDRLSYGEP